MINFDRSKYGDLCIIRFAYIDMRVDEKGMIKRVTKIKRVESHEEMKEQRSADKSENESTR